MQEFDLKERDFHERLEDAQTRLNDRKKLNYQIQTDYFNYKNTVD